MQYFHSNTSYYLQLLLEGQALVPLEAWMMDYILDIDMALGLDAPFMHKCRMAGYR